MLGLYVTADQDLEFGFFLALLAHPLGEAFHGHQLSLHDVGSVLVDIDLDQVACGPVATLDGAPSGREWQRAGPTGQHSEKPEASPRARG